MIFSVAQIVNYYWDQESVYGKTNVGEWFVKEKCL